MAKDEKDAGHAGMTEVEMKTNVVRLAFGGDTAKFEAFCRVLSEAIPLDTAAVIRGSSVTGERWEDNAPFDAEGPGTSDVDLTLVGAEILPWYVDGGFYIAGVHTKPLSDEHPQIAPRLVSLRDRLTAMVGRPVNIQGTRDWVMFVREYLMGQPYLTIIGKVDST